MLDGLAGVLWRLHDGRGYADLYPLSIELSDDERRVRIVGLDALIDIKQAAARPRDREDVAWLTRIRERQRSER